MIFGGMQSLFEVGEAKDCLDSDGLVYLLHRDLSVTSYRAYQCRVSHLVQLKQQNVIVSIGVSRKLKKREKCIYIQLLIQEDDERGHIVKIWNVEKVRQKKKIQIISININILVYESRRSSPKSSNSSFVRYQTSQG